jgi:hypothetical protein
VISSAISSGSTSRPVVIPLAAGTAAIKVA